MTIAHPELEGIGKYEYGWSDPDTAGSTAKRGLNEEVVRDISSKKSEIGRRPFRLFRFRMLAA